ncbi:MAG: NAD(P)/FAD-dependent oxidoreductase [Mycobacteriales bacterium]
MSYEYDIAVIGAGVVGAAIARELSLTALRVVVLEASGDVGTGTSKANTAIRHTGFDAKPGSLESALLRRGYPLLDRYAKATGIPLERTGALLVAWTAAEAAALDRVVATAEANGYAETRRLDAAELYAAEPHLGPGAQAALEIPGEGVICPFTTPIAFATEAARNGVDFRFHHRVERAVDDGLRYDLGGVRARWVVNAAGLGSGDVDRLFGYEEFTVTPRRGELIIFDKLARPLLNHVLLPVPTERTKGVLIAPTVFGNVLLGPTAEDVPDRTATATTAAGLAQLREAGRRVLPALLDEEVTSMYAGLRAATEHADYQIRAHPDRRYVCVGGIRSSGLSASMGIAAHVYDLLCDAGLDIDQVRDSAMVGGEGHRVPPVGETWRRPYADTELIAANPDYGEVVCFCERITLGEVRAALRGPVPAPDLDGVRRRTRAGLGRCQGFYCAARLQALVAP